MDMFTVKRRDDVLELLNTYFKEYPVMTETVPLKEAVGRVVAEPVMAGENVPSFRRSTVDGYAVKAKNTVGCSESLPAFLEMVGETQMGEGTSLVISDYQAVYVPTGGIVPEGADAVVMIEYTDNMDTEIAINRPVHPLENIVGIGDDVHQGEIVIPEKTLLRTQHIGALAAIGIDRVSVLAALKVGILSTGDELVPVDQPLEIGQIRDVNTHSLEAMVTAIGCRVVYEKRVIDHFEALKETLDEALDQCDVILMSGGSSVGNHDMTPEVINSLGKPGVLVHGVAIKPGKPTIIGQVRGKAVFGLPGHPASCIIAYKTIVESFIQTTLLKWPQKPFKIIAEADFQAHVSSGRDVFYMVKLIENEKGYTVRPVHGKSGMVTLLSEADGYIEIPMEKEGIQKGDTVEVYLFK